KVFTTTSGDNPRGQFTLPSIPHGSYTLGAEDSAGYLARSRTTLTLAPGEGRNDLTVVVDRAAQIDVATKAYQNGALTPSFIDASTILVDAITPDGTPAGTATHVCAVVGGVLAPDYTTACSTQAVGAHVTRITGLADGDYRLTYEHAGGFDNVVHPST